MPWEKASVYFTDIIFVKAERLAAEVGSKARPDALVTVPAHMPISDD